MCVLFKYLHGGIHHPLIRLSCHGVTADEALIDESENPLAFVGSPEPFKFAEAEPDSLCVEFGNFG
ncbi:hypothetical protein ART_0637 [Arthrobacter sp. PAMC 25486]|nr:hypothetical protein ART_0637 [Arthrobacter sp. PAMC 25486]